MISKTTKSSTVPVAKLGLAVCRYAIVKGLVGISDNIRSVARIAVDVPTFVGVVASAPLVEQVPKKKSLLKYASPVVPEYVHIPSPKKPVA
jgi:hypothetical protein